MQNARMSIPRQHNCDALHTHALPPFLGLENVRYALVFHQLARIRLVLVVVGLRTETRSRSRKPFNEGTALQTVIKEVVGIHVLLTRSLFACDILRRLLLRVSLARSDFCSFAILMASLK